MKNRICWSSSCVVEAAKILGAGVVGCDKTFAAQSAGTGQNAHPFSRAAAVMVASRSALPVPELPPLCLKVANDVRFSRSRAANSACHGGSSADRLCMLDSLRRIGDCFSLVNAIEICKRQVRYGIS